MIWNDLVRCTSPCRRLAGPHKTEVLLLDHRLYVQPRLPTGSWLNLVERWSAEFTQKWLRRGTHRSKNMAQSVDKWGGELVKLGR